MLKNIKIKTKIIFSFLLLIILFSFLSLFYYKESKKEIINIISESSSYISEAVLHGVDLILKDSFEYIIEPAKDETIINFIKEENKKFANIKNKEQYISQMENKWSQAKKTNILPPEINQILNNPTSTLLKKLVQSKDQTETYINFKEIFITNKEGINIAMSNLTTDFDQSDELWWQEAKKNGSFIGKIAFDQSVNIYAIDICQKIVDENNNFLGVVKGVFNIEAILSYINHIENLINQHLLSPLHVMILTKENKIFYYTEKKIFQEQLSVGKDKLISLSPEKKEKFFLFLPTSHLHRPEMNKNWTIVIAYPKKQMDFYLKDFRYLIWVGLSIIFLITLLFIFLFFKIIAKPLINLKNTITKIDTSQLYIQKLNLTTQDEIGQLAQSFDNMIETLNAQNKAKIAMISTVSHELRIPLTVMKEGISLILEEKTGSLQEEQKKLLTTIKSNIDRLARIINDILDIKKIETKNVILNKKQVDFIALVKNVTETFKPKIKEKNLQLKTDFSDEHIYMLLDPDKITEVLLNLFDNALKFTEKGFIEVQVKNFNDKVQFSIADSGIGISKEFLKEAFEQFKQFIKLPNSKEKGTGLGLAISKGFIEQHKGTINIESELNKGTKVTFTIPKT